MAGRRAVCGAGLVVRYGAMAAAAACWTAAADDRPFPRDDAGYERIVVPLFREHCMSCHVGESPEGEFSIAKKHLGTDFTKPLFAARWREVVNVLNAHEMPPADERQPDPGDVAAVVDWITRQAVAAEQLARSRAVVLRRLNRAEYRNTIRDLVGIDFDTAAFPLDPPAGGFDNNGQALTMSPFQIGQYLSAAEEIIDRALVSGARPNTVRWRFDPQAGPADRVRVRLDERNNPLVNGGNNRSEGEWVVIHHDQWDKSVGARDFRVPVAGSYLVRLRVAGRRPDREAVVASAGRLLDERRAKDDAKQPDRAAQHAAALARDLEHFRTDPMYDYGPARLKLTVQLGSQPRTIAEFDVEGGQDAPQTLEFPVRFTTETAGIKLEYAYAVPAVLENFWLQKNDAFARPEALIDWIELEGPLHDAWPPTTHTRILFDSPKADGDREGYVREVLERFMTQAYRRPVTDAEVEEKAALVRAAKGRTPLVERLEPALVAVLSSPHFLYLAETLPGEAGQQLDDHEIATRLSYFLWSTMPDAELRQLAVEGKLASPAVRGEQVERMLADERIAHFIDNFAGQWLGFREVGANPPAPDLFPQYDRHLELSLAGEQRAYVREFLLGDLDARHMLASDFVTINERLGRFYGIPGVRGDAFRKVPVPPGVQRGGIVTQAAMLTITSNGTRTSPVKRGTWILKTLLGTDPGLPVANAGEIAPKVPGIDKATVRERLEIHRQQRQCARCHDKIDPLGFALENFNAAGEWRDREGFGYKGRVQANDPPIDASARMPDGTRIDGVAGLQRAMLAQERLFLRSLATHLLTYALGRELGLADQPEVDAIFAAMRAEPDGPPTLRGLVKAIVSSDLFVTK